MSHNYLSYFYEFIHQIYIIKVNIITDLKAHKESGNTCKNNIHGKSNDYHTQYIK